MEDLQLNVEDADHRAEWRRRTRVADPLPGGSTVRRSERERERERGMPGYTVLHNLTSVSALATLKVTLQGHLLDVSLVVYVGRSIWREI